MYQYLFWKCKSLEEFIMLKLKIVFIDLALDK